MLNTEQVSQKRGVEVVYRSKNIVGFILAGLVIALLFALIYSRWMRVIMIPAELRYIPPEMNIIFASGDISSVWDGVEYNFGKVMREKDRQGFLSETINEIDKQLREKGIPVSGKRDLFCRYGIDIDRGLLAAALADAENRWIAVIPVANDKKWVQQCSGTINGGKERLHDPFTETQTNESRMLGFFKKFFDNDPVPLKQWLLDNGGQVKKHPCLPLLSFHNEEDPSWQAIDHAYLFDDRYVLVMPQRDTVLLQESCSQLLQSLNEQDNNLSYAREADFLFGGIRNQLRRPLMTGASVLVHLRGLAHNQLVPPLNMTLAINLLSDGVRGAAQVETQGFRAKIVDDILNISGQERPWQAYMDPDEASTLVLHDQAISRYIDFASHLGEFRNWSESFLGGLLVPGGQLVRVDQIVLSVTGYRDGLPLLVAGLWGSKDDFQDLIFETRRELRQSRDQAVLEGAVEAYQAAQGALPSTLQELLTDGVLAITPDSWFKRFNLEPDGISGVYPLRSNFETAEYRESYRGKEILFLEPRITDADLDFRLRGNKPKDQERKNLLENRRRLCATQYGDTLLVATGKDLLTAMIDRSLERTNQDNFITVRGADDHPKLRGIATVRTLVRSGLLSGENRLQKFTEQFLLDFRQFRNIRFSLSPSEKGQGVILKFDTIGQVKSKHRMSPYQTTMVNND